MDANDKRYDYNRFGKKGKRVGQAVVDILSKDQPIYTAEEILNEYAPKFVQELEDCIKENHKKYTSPFYVFVLTGKEMWAENVLRNWFVARQTPPHAIDMVVEFPHKSKTLYMVDAEKGKVKVLWTIPGIEDCKSIMKDPLIYDPHLVQWIIDCFEGKLNKDSYSFEEKIEPFQKI